MDQSLFHQLRMLLSLEIDSFEEHLRTLRSSHYPSNVACDFIDCLNAELEGQRSAIYKQVSSVFPHDPEGAAKNLRSQHRILASKLNYLNFLKNAQTEEVPWSVVPSIERLASQLIPERDLLTTCTHDMNYRISWHQSPTLSIRQRFMFLELPGIHKTNAFLHILIGHELFHPLLEDFLNENGRSVLERLREPCTAFLSEQSSPKPTVGKVVDEACYIWRRALKEVMCDLGCAAVFGPAALFASSVWLLPGDLDDPPSLAGDFYPPPRFRLREILRYAFQNWDAGPEQSPPTAPDTGRANPLDDLRRLLSREGFGEASGVLAKQFRIIKNETDKNTDLDKIAERPLVKIAYNEVNKLLPKAWDPVREKV